jgi:hypothetical protein
MKLVELLAKELGEWPDDSGLTICQDYDGEVGIWRITDPRATKNLGDTTVVWHSRGHITNINKLSCIATDHATAIVTREMWEAERAKQSCERADEGAADILSRAAKDSGYICWMRDRICEIDGTIEAMTAERSQLVEKLYAEGFMLVVVESEPANNDDRS